MNAHPYAGQFRAQELRAEASHAREVLAARGQSEHPSLLQLIKALVVSH